MIISAYAGETIKIETTILDQNGTPIDLSDGVAKFALKLKDSDVVVVKDATIMTNHISVTLSSTETSITGRYEYEFRTLLNGEEDRVDGGVLIIQNSLFKGLSA